MRRYEDTYSAKKTEKKTELEDDDVFSPQSDDETGNSGFQCESQRRIKHQKEEILQLKQIAGARRN